MAIEPSSKKTKQQKDLDALILNIESKYAKPSKSKKPHANKEPSEEEFQQARERLEGMKKKRS